MTWLAMLVGLVLPACGGEGAAGVPIPPPGLLDHLERPASPNTALAAPADFTPKPDIVLPVYQVPAPLLYQAIRAVARAMPRVFPQIAYDGQLEAHYVARSALINFPDLIVAKVSPAGNAASTLVLYSRSVYGYSDLGVNRQRLQAWLAALDTSRHTKSGS